ncbi:MAG: hypothetical protein JXR76_09335 [Deltaproteobacteria bacterium]|nr:hypothetical protein [Deltaproteobacteria bacterium]
MKNTNTRHTTPSIPVTDKNCSNKADFQILLLLALSLFSFAGCFSTSTLHTARPITPGSNEISVVPVMVGLAAPNEKIVDSDGNTVGETDVDLAVPSVEGQFRHGFSDRFDMGVKLYLIGAEMDFNVLLVDKPKFALSMDPAFTASYFAAGDSQVFIGTFWLPLLFDVVTTDKITVTIGPKPGFLVAAVSGGTDYEDGESDSDVYSESSADGMLGGMVGVKVQFTPRFHMMPEFNGVWEFKAQYFWWTAALSFGFEI